MSFHFLGHGQVLRSALKREVISMHLGNVAWDPGDP